MLKRPNSGQDGPLVTIITVSAFEHERLLKTLDSFIRLDNSFEIVFVVPGSDHAAVQAIKLYEKRLAARISIVNDIQKGIYPAMNLGIHSSSGEFSIFLNAGDEVSDSFNLEDFSYELGNVRENWVILRPTLSWSVHHIEHASQVEDFFSLNSDAFISHQAVLFRTEILRELRGYNSRYKVIGDTALMYQFFKRGKPFMSSNNLSKVETPKFASINQRKSRVEFLSLILSTYRWDIKLKATSNFFKREAVFLFLKKKSKHD